MAYDIDWFAYLVESFIPWINPTWSSCMILLIGCWILFARISLRIFISMFISDTSLWFSIFVMFFPGFSNLRYADDTTFMAESKELKSLLMKSERGEWKSWLKTQHSENQDHGIWSHHFMANRRETVETVTDFIIGGSKITADGNCLHEIKRRLLLRRKVMTNLDSIIKSRGITLPTKVCLVTVREGSNLLHDDSAQQTSLTADGESEASQTNES